MEKKVLVQIAERAEPAKGAGEKNNARDVAEQEIAQPTPARIFARKPNRDDERRQRNPAKPALIERRKANSSQHSARGRGEPRPETKRVSDHCAELNPVADAAVRARGGDPGLSASRKSRA